MGNCLKKWVKFGKQELFEMVHWIIRDFLENVDDGNCVAFKKLMICYCMPHIEEFCHCEFGIGPNIYDIWNMKNRKKHNDRLV